MNWILKYRINPDWFLDDDNKLKILKLIKNHDLFTESNHRNIRVSYLLGNNVVDPLDYLNKYLNYIYGKDYVVLESPQHYMGSGKLITASTCVCDDFFEWFDTKSIKYKIYLYQICLSGKIDLRGALIIK